MGDVYDRHEAMADEHKAGLINTDGTPVDGFDTPDQFDNVAEKPAADKPAAKSADPARPDAVRGRYTLPNPVNGKSKSWQRVTNFIKLADDTYHLELWKQRNVAKGAAMLVQAGRVTVDHLAGLHVKADKDRLNSICEAAQNAAEAYKLADEGTALHASTEIADYAGGSIAGVPPQHCGHVGMYLDALARNGLRVVPEMIERVTASQRYEVAGKFDRIYRLPDGSYVIGDLKTGDSLDLSFPSIAGQLACYEDGINNTGIWDGSRYDTSIKVRTDFGIVVHLPSTRDEVTVYRVDLSQGHELNRVCLEVRQARKIKARHVAEVFRPGLYAQPGPDTEQQWLEEMNAVHTYDQLVEVARRAQVAGQWVQRLADQARIVAAELRKLNAVAGS